MATQQHTPQPPHTLPIALDLYSSPEFRAEVDLEWWDPYQGDGTVPGPRVYWAWAWRAARYITSGRAHRDRLLAQAARLQAQAAQAALAQVLPGHWLG